MMSEVTSLLTTLHVITDWSISDHMNSSKQDVTSSHHCLLLVKSVNDHRGHMVQGYSQQPCTM
ncbi:unnamed protein product [Staurois parvus]|uniref:Uncharacterized protein n=1 Tax=Staurois parvus TaxID=386267 RepID=A0ABN9D6C8_9NEOB|nr:unnamed protein product [Staurois parvus]